MQTVTSRKILGGGNSNNNEAINQLSIFRDEFGKGANSATQRSSLLPSANLHRFSTNSNILFDVHYEESDILQIEERKRRIGELGGLGQGDTEMGYANTGPKNKNNNDGAGIFGDLTPPTEPVLAELARQANQPK